MPKAPSMRWRRHPRALAAVTLLGLLPSAQGTASYWRFVEIAPPLAGQEVWAWDLNNHGAVAGYVGRPAELASFDSQAFSWSQSAGWQQRFVGQAWAIDDAGRVAGGANGQWLRSQGFANAEGGRRAFVTGGSELLPTPANASGSFNSIALGLGPGGSVVGFSTFSGGSGEAAAVWNAGAMAPVAPGGGDPNDFSIAWVPGANPINASGTLVGHSGRVGSRQLATWSSQAGVVNLGSPFGSDTEGLSINNAGQIAGISGNQGFRWSPVTGFQTLDVAGSALNVAQSINAGGDVAGYHLGSLAGSSVYYDARAVVWRADGSLFDVNAARIVDRGDFVFTQVRDINDRGQMLVWGYDGANPQFQRAFLMAECLRCGQIAPYPNPESTVLDVGADWFDAYNEVNFVNAGTLVIGTVLDNRGTGVLRNNGRLEITSAGTVFQRGQVVNSAGAQWLINGSLRQEAGGTLNSGEIRVGADAKLLLAGSGWSNEEGSRFSMSGGAATNTSSFSVNQSRFEMSGGDFATNETGSFTVSSGDVLLSGGVFSNSGALLVSRDSISSPGRAGTLAVQAGASLQNRTGATFTANQGSILTVSGQLDNSGRLVLADAGTRLTVAAGGVFHHSGRLDIGKGATVSFAEGAAHFRPDIGRIEVMHGGRLELGRGTKISIDGASRLDSSGRIDLNTAKLEVSGQVFLNADAQFRLNEGSSIDVGAGGFEIAGGALVTGDGFFKQIGGLVRIDGELAASDSNFAGGVLMGSGVVSGRAVMGSTVSTGTVMILRPGLSPGTLTFNGSLEVNRNVEIELEVASATVYDRLIINGDASFNGALIKLLPDALYDAELDDRFDFVSTSGSWSAHSVRFDDRSLPTGWTSNWRLGGSGVQLQIDNPSVPELSPVAAADTVRIGADQWRWTRDAYVEGRLEVAGRLTHREGFDPDTGEPASGYLTIDRGGALQVERGGRFTNRSEFRLQGALVNAGEMHNRSGGTMRFETDETNQGPIVNQGRIVNEGHLVTLPGTLLQQHDGAVAVLGGTVDHGGGIDLRPGSLLEVPKGGWVSGTGWIFASAGSRVIIDGDLAVDLTLQGGTLSGHGRIDTRTRVFGGTVQPGGEFEIGTLTMAGELAMSGARLQLDVGADGMDLLDASAALVTLGDGNLDIALRFGIGLSPQAGDSFTLLTAGTGSWLDLGRIDVRAELASPGGFTVWNPDPALITTSLSFKDGTLSYHVTAVPEPGTWGLMGLGLLAVAAAARRQRLQCRAWNNEHLAKAA